MNWTQLLAPARLSGAVDDHDAPRSPFQRDYDRVLYSSAFRRLGDKTQVFPVPLDDHIHSRLTHSLEVATIGRSLGTLAGRGIATSAGLPAGVDARDVGDCVAAACLAHDLGNPPFGHVGEDAFREFFDGFFGRHDGAAWTDTLDGAECLDLKRFEGNAQSLRIVTRLARPLSGHGLDLTCPTLGALVKYPCASTSSLGKQGGRTSRAKHGINQAELPVFAEVATRTGLPVEVAAATATVWRRHPLAFLTEAADDIAYRIIDFEDGLRLGLVEPAQFIDHMRPLCEGERGCPAPLEPRAGREPMFDLAMTLRGIGLNRLIHEAGAVFAAHHQAILDGGFDDALLDHVPSRTAVLQIERVNLERCYRARDVLKMELSGAVAIEGVLEALADAAVNPGSLRAGHLHRLLPGVLRDEDVYTRLLRVTDHVSGMTDNYLVRRYRELSGIRLPGGRD